MDAGWNVVDYTNEYRSDGLEGKMFMTEKDGHLPCGKEQDLPFTEKLLLDNYKIFHGRDDCKLVCQDKPLYGSNECKSLVPAFVNMMANKTYEFLHGICENKLIFRVTDNKTGKVTSLINIEGRPGECKCEKCRGQKIIPTCNIDPPITKPKTPWYFARTDKPIRLKCDEKKVIRFDCVESGNANVLACNNYIVTLNLIVSNTNYLVIKPSLKTCDKNIKLGDGKHVEECSINIKNYINYSFPIIKSAGELVISCHGNGNKKRDIIIHPDSWILVKED